MPKSWFFEIHEDTPDQEAANLMEHSASTLDISSDDDADTRRHSEAMERGKENVPPPENFANLPASELAHSSIPTHNIPSSTASTTGSKKTRRGRKEAHPDAMLEDRTPLGDLDASEFFAEGLNADSKVIIPADVTSPQKPSGLSKVFDFSIPPSPKAKLEAAKSDKGKGKGKEVETEANVDAQSKEIYICEDEL